MQQTLQLSGLEKVAAIMMCNTTTTTFACNIATYTQAPKSLPLPPPSPRPPNIFRTIAIALRVSQAGSSQVINMQGCGFSMWERLLLSEILEQEPGVMFNFLSGCIPGLFVEMAC